MIVCGKKFRKSLPAFGKGDSGGLSRRFGSPRALIALAARQLGGFADLQIDMPDRRNRNRRRRPRQRSRRNALALNLPLPKSPVRRQANRRNLPRPPQSARNSSRDAARITRRQVWLSSSRCHRPHFAARPFAPLEPRRQQTKHGDRLSRRDPFLCLSLCGLCGSDSLVRLRQMCPRRR